MILNLVQNVLIHDFIVHSTFHGQKSQKCLKTLDCLSTSTQRKKNFSTGFYSPLDCFVFESSILSTTPLTVSTLTQVQFQQTAKTDLYKLIYTPKFSRQYWKAFILFNNTNILQIQHRNTAKLCSETDSIFFLKCILLSNRISLTSTANKYSDSTTVLASFRLVVY